MVKHTAAPPQEASGTRGMKAQAKGVLNVSTQDCRWDEAWHIGCEKHAEVGWAIGKGETYQDPCYQDQVWKLRGRVCASTRCPRQFRKLPSAKS